MRIVVVVDGGGGGGGQIVSTTYLPASQPYRDVPPDSPRG